MAEACAGVPRTAPAGGGTRWWRRFAPVWAAGLLGVASLLLVAPPPAALDALPHASSWPPLAVRALLALNPLLLVTLFAAVGAALAHRVGVTSLLAGTRRIDPVVIAASLWRAAALGGAAGLAFAWVDIGLLPRVDADASAALQRASAAAPGLVVALLYGGVAEEVIARWGLMSAAAWAIARTLGHAPRLRASTVARAACAPAVTPAVAAAAALVAAVAFAVAHLPALAAVTDVTPVLLARTLGLNVAAGLLCGALAFRHGLEAAIVAHAAMHLGIAAGAALLA